MSFDIEELKRKINYRSNYRGTKEMDVILNSFVKSVIDDFNYEELEMLDYLVNIDDENLHNLNKDMQTSVEIKENKVVNLFKKFRI